VEPLTTLITLAMASMATADPDHALSIGSSIDIFWRLVRESSE
jgi:hypothetical protein